MLLIGRLTASCSVSFSPPEAHLPRNSAAHSGLGLPTSVNLDNPLQTSSRLVSKVIREPTKFITEVKRYSEARGLSLKQAWTHRKFQASLGYLVILYLKSKTNKTNDIK